MISNNTQQAFTSKTKGPSEPELQSTLIALLYNSLGLTFLFLDLMKASISLKKRLNHVCVAATSAVKV